MVESCSGGAIRSLFDTFRTHIALHFSNALEIWIKYIKICMAEKRVLFWSVSTQIMFIFFNKYLKNDVNVKACFANIVNIFDGFQSLASLCILQIHRWNVAGRGHNKGHTCAQWITHTRTRIATKAASRSRPQNSSTATPILMLVYEHVPTLADVSHNFSLVNRAHAPVIVL